jgi:hypothetical protein
VLGLPADGFDYRFYEVLAPGWAAVLLLRRCASPFAMIPNKCNKFGEIDLSGKFFASGSGIDEGRVRTAYTSSVYNIRPCWARLTRAGGAFSLGLVWLRGYIGLLAC